MIRLPTFDDVVAAAGRIDGIAHRTPVLTSRTADAELGARVKFSNGKPTVVDGPFTETKELIAGFSIIQVGSRQEALDWIRRWPASDAGGNVELELRQVYEAEDFGAEFTPELRANEERLRAVIDQRSGGAKK